VCVFFLFLSHLIDFPLVRLMDMSFWYTLHFVFQESYENFVELLLASNVSIFVWVLAALSAVLLVFSGVFFYRMSERGIRRYKWVLSFPMLGVLMCAACFFLLSWDFAMKKRVSTLYFDRFEKALPWKSTFFRPRVDYLPLKNPLRGPESEAELMRKLDS